MKWDEIERAWPDVKEKIRFRWCRLSDEELEQSGGKRERIVAQIDRHYSVRKENIERDLDALIESL
jgi:uncharacterized protein YjbJ (UPF0337 family)